MTTDQLMIMMIEEVQRCGFDVVAQCPRIAEWPSPHREDGPTPSSPYRQRVPLGRGDLLEEHVLEAVSERYFGPSTPSATFRMMEMWQRFPKVRSRCFGLAMHRSESELLWR